MRNAIWVAIFEKKLPEASVIKAEHWRWRPWVGDDPKDAAIMPRLALHRHIRDRGGVGSDEEPLAVFVCLASDYPPKECTFTEFKVTKD